MPAVVRAAGQGLVLASLSPYRRQLLARLGQPFAWQAPNIDETAQVGEPPDRLVRRLALAKARALASTYADHLLIGSDQVAVNGGQTLGKPGDRGRAMAQLVAASGRTVQFVTSVCVLESRSGRHATEVVTCSVVFRQLSAAQIAAYVERETPFDCAGSFKAEGLGIALFERIVTTDPTALTGLPLIALTRMLADVGLDVLTASPGQAVTMYQIHQ